MNHEFTPYEGWEEDLAACLAYPGMYHGSNQPATRLTDALKPAHEHDWRVNPYSVGNTVRGATRMHLVCEVCAATDEKLIAPDRPKSEWPRYVEPS